MLTGKQVRVKYVRDKIIPWYIDPGDPNWVEVAEGLLTLFRCQDGHTHGELDEDVRDLTGSDPTQLVHQGLAKLLEDRCEFEVVSGHPPDQLRELVFASAAEARKSGSSKFDRQTVLSAVAVPLGLTPEAVDQGMFADLKSEQRLIRFKDITAERLVERYNVALAQSILLRSTRVQITVSGEPPQRYRQLMRLVKFHRLVCDVKKAGPDSYKLMLDGPLSLFSATQKYGLQLALFLPAVLLCRNFDLKAELTWGPQRKPKTFTLDPDDGLVSHLTDTGMYVPPELSMFVDLFRKKITEWEIFEESDVQPLGDSFWVPDFRLVERATGRAVFLEVLGFWRKSSVEKHLSRLRANLSEPFILAVSDQLHVDDESLEGLPAAVHRFRQMPLPDEVCKLASALLR